MFISKRSKRNSHKANVKFVIVCLLAVSSMTMMGCAGLVSASKPGNVTPTPAITGASPTAGAIGAAVTISGANFGTAQGASTVMFNGIAATATSWGATSIAVTVPAGATTGNLMVTVGGAASNGVNFTVTSPGPSITGLNPTSGLAGATVTITGSNFGATQGTSTVKFNGTAATAASWSATSIAVTVPTAATTGSVVVTVGGVASNGVSFAVTVPPPTIASLNPTSGVLGAPVTITGMNFGATQGTSTVTFNGIAATPTSWSATSIVVPVPAGALTGNVVVTVGGAASNGVSFTVTSPGPSITALNPSSGLLGTAATITGANFGATQGTSTVKFNGTAATATSWSATSIVVTVPTGATTGSVVVTVGGVASNPVTFTVTASVPTITSLSPTSGLIGAAVTITGTNFGATQGTSTVKFNGIAATATSWSATSIVVTVPAGSTTGNVVVTIGGVASNGVSFTVTVPTPSITSLNPTSGFIGAAVTITGTNFGATQGTSTVKFNGTVATAASWNATSIVVTVPTGATTGNVVVTVGGAASNGVSFTVTVLTPSITTLNPTSGFLGTSVTITGTNFGATKGTSTVKFNGTTAIPTTWSATSIVVPAPTGATTGPVMVTVGGVGSNGMTFTVQADTTPPTTPTGLTATAASSSQISLSWTASTDNVGVAGYKVFRGGTQVGTSTGTTYGDSGLAASTSYTYNVAAFDAAGNTSAQSNSASATTLSSTASCASGLPCALGWYQIPNTAIANIIPTYSEIQAQTGPTAVMGAWGGGTFDTQRNRMIIKGGGHNDWFGNELEGIDFDANPIAPILIKDASHGAQVANVTSCPESYSDGSPSGRHTYDGIQYLPTQDRYYLRGNFKSNCGFGTDTVWIFDPCTGVSPFCPGQNTIPSGSNGWASFLPSTHPDPASDGSTPMEAYDPVTDALYTVATNSAIFWRYNPTSNTWTQLGSNGGCGNLDMTSAIDPIGRNYYCIGGGNGPGGFSKVSLNAPYTETDLGSTASGCSTLISTNAPGFKWDPIQQVFVGWAGGSTYYTYNPATNSCTADTDGTFTGGPATIASNGTYGRFQYVPTLGGFVLVNDISSNAYFLRLVSPAGAALTDFNNRKGQASVTNSQGFDSNAFLSMTDPNRNNASILNCNGTNLTAPNVCPQIFQDSSIFSSGSSSMRLDCTGQSGSQCSGYWYMYLNTTFENGTSPGYGPNSDWWVQIHVRGNQELFTTDWEGLVQSTTKHFIMHQAYPDFGSCSNVEITSVQAGSNTNSGPNNHPFPGYYSQCGDLSFSDFSTTGSAQAGVTNNVTCTQGSPCDQQGDYWCHYNTFNDCLTWSAVPNEWMVETLHVHFGTSGGSDSTFDAWLNKPGRPPRHFMMMRNLNLQTDAGCPATWSSGNDCYYQVIDFMLYFTNKNQSVAHPTASMWIDEVIASSTQIPAPQAPAATQP